MVTFVAVIPTSIHSTAVYWASTAGCPLPAFSPGLPATSNANTLRHNEWQWRPRGSCGFGGVQFFPNWPIALSNDPIRKASFRKLNIQTDHNFVTMVWVENKMNHLEIITFTLGLKRNQQPNQVENFILLPSAFPYLIESRNSINLNFLEKLN